MSQEDFQQQMNKIFNTYYMADEAVKKVMYKPKPSTKPKKYLGNGSINPEYKQWEEENNG